MSAVTIFTFSIT